MPGGYAIIACFAPTAPDHCSGLPVHRSSADDIVDRLGSEFSLVDSSVQVHTTPSSREQPFTWVTARRGGLLSDLDPLLEPPQILWHLAGRLAAHDERHQQLSDPVAGEVQLDRQPGP